jgi:C-terminal processing protease CtpA/Prc
VNGTGIVDIGDVKILKRRAKNGDLVGELGVHFVEQPENTPVDQQLFKVSWIDPAGPAAKTELKLGDVIATIDGIDVTGASHSNGEVLMEAPPGTAIKLGLSRGVTVTVVLAAP